MTRHGGGWNMRGGVTLPPGKEWILPETVTKAMAGVIVFDRCKRCHGMKQIVIDGLRVNCPDCGGKGLIVVDLEEEAARARDWKEQSRDERI